MGIMLTIANINNILKLQRNPNIRVGTRNNGQTNRSHKQVSIMSESIKK